MRSLVVVVAASVVVAVGLAACSPLKTINLVTPEGSFARTADIAYGDASVRQQLDVYVPVKGIKPPPVVVFFYGGSWTGGSRKDYMYVAQALAARGIMTVVPDYRLSPEVVYPAFVQDSAKAVAWTLDNIAQYGGDVNRVFVMGHSAGGYNAAMVALDDRWLKPYGKSPAALKGWIGLAGPYDFLPIVNPDIKPAFLYPDTPKDSQPVVHASAASPPALLLAGSKDDVVDPNRNTVQMTTLLRAKGVYVDEDVYEGLGHAMMVGVIAWPLRSRAPVLDRVVDFIERDGKAPAAESVSAGKQGG